jgi:hypothetical protein
VFGVWRRNKWNNGIMEKWSIGKLGNVQSMDSENKNKYLY